MAAVHECGFGLVDHSPYSPDLATSDYFLFPNMNKYKAGKQYIWNGVISAVEDFSEDQDESFYTTKIQVLQHQWKKCVGPPGRLCWKINHIVLD